GLVGVGLQDGGRVQQAGDPLGAARPGQELGPAVDVVPDRADDGGVEGAPVGPGVVPAYGPPVDAGLAPGGEYGLALVIVTVGICERDICTREHPVMVAPAPPGNAGATSAANRQQLVDSS